MSLSYLDELVVGLTRQAGEVLERGAVVELVVVDDLVVRVLVDQQRDRVRATTSEEGRNLPSSGFRFYILDLRSFGRGGAHMNPAPPVIIMFLGVYPSNAHSILGDDV
jgi:hypothetical protein